MGLNTYFSIGNSDDRLPQLEWSRFVADVNHLVQDAWQTGMLLIHGTWYSAPDQPWQNANWCVEILPPKWWRAVVGGGPVPMGSAMELRKTQDMTADREALKESLRRLCGHYRQDTFAWATAEVELVETDYQALKAVAIEVGTGIVAAERRMQTRDQLAHPYLDDRMRETLAMNRRDQSTPGPVPETTPGPGSTGERTGSLGGVDTEYDEADEAPRGLLGEMS